MDARKKVWAAGMTGDPAALSRRRLEKRALAQPFTGPPTISAAQTEGGEYRPFE